MHVSIHTTAVRASWNNHQIWPYIKDQLLTRLPRQEEPITHTLSHTRPFPSKVAAADMPRCFACLLLTCGCHRVMLLGNYYFQGNLTTSHGAHFKWTHWLADYMSTLLCRILSRFLSRACAAYQLFSPYSGQRHSQHKQRDRWH